MTIKRFYIRGTAKRRGDILPARLRFSAHRGVTLVELMISMLILALVCVAWLEIIGGQSARKEARRREAVERLAGMMDAFMCHYKSGKNASTGKNLATGSYAMTNYLNTIDFLPQPASKKLDVVPLFDDAFSPIGYQLLVIDKAQISYPESDFVRWNRFVGWDKVDRDHPSRWLVGLLYNRSGDLSASDNPPFFVLPVCLGL